MRVWREARLWPPTTDWWCEYRGVPPNAVTTTAARPAGWVIARGDVARTAALVTAASPFLARVLRTDPLAPDVLASLDRRVERSPHRRHAEGLARWKRLEMLRIAARERPFRRGRARARRR